MLYFYSKIFTISGPGGKLEYLGNNIFKIRDKPFRINKLGMIAAGSGITPMFQVFKY
jgi:hypothetical protein